MVIASASDEAMLKFPRFRALESQRIVVGFDKIYMCGMLMPLVLSRVWSGIL